MSTVQTSGSAMTPYHVPRDAGALAVPAVAERAPSDTVAFVLQGGGSLCASQVGTLRALTQAGVRPDLVVGSSAGALNGAAFAADPSIEGIDRLEALWLRLKRRHIAPISLRTLIRAAVGRGEAAVSSAALQQLLRSGLGVGRLEETAVPVHAVATDFETGAAVVLSRGDAVSALLASAAFPGLYPPVPVGERRLIDGGVSADMPVLQAEALGATTIYVLPAAVTEQVDRQPHAAALLAAYRALGQILDERERRDLAAVRGSVLRLPTATTPVGSLIDFRDTPRLIEVGYRLTQDWLVQRPAATVRES
ncbi:patatin-like phospholipase family protein [Streptomyces sp. NPDC001984]|uniref:patatin-like phospholipase family protein n=1 Tax=Streptomyces sp. NPDC002619 TaxID=3364655 RepID=UPI0036A07331